MDRQKHDTALWQPSLYHRVSNTSDRKIVVVRDLAARGGVIVIVFEDPPTRESMGSIELMFV